MKKSLLRKTVVPLVSLPVWVACTSIAPQPEMANDPATRPVISPDGRNPNSMLAVPGTPEAPPATGVQTISVPAYIFEPEVAPVTGITVEELTKSGIQLQVMDRALPLKPGDGAKRQANPADQNQSQAGPQPIPAPPLAPPALSTNFGSLDFVDNVTETGGMVFIPPDPDAAAGPHHVVAVVNTAIEFLQMNGTVDFTDSLKDFFSAESPDTFTFDPKVVFDPFEGRFVVITLEKEDDGAGGNPEVSEIFLAVSDDANPNGTWCTTTISGNTDIGGTDHWADYPGFSVDEEAVYITNNIFEFSGGSPFSKAVRLWVVDKGAGSGGFYDCGAAVVNKFDPIVAGAFNLTMQPAQIHGTAPAVVGTFLSGYGGLTGGGFEFLQIIRVDDPLGAPVFTVDFVNVGNIEDFASFLDAPQSGLPGVIPIETNDRRALDAEWFDDSLWVTASISPKAGDTDAGEVTAHWWEVDTSVLGAPALADQGNMYGDDLTADMFTFFPSVAVNGLGQVGFGFSGSASTIFGSSYYTARNPADAAGSTQGTTLLQAGVATYIRTFCGSNRWGDYSSIETDPIDGCFWVYNEHAMTTGTPTTGCPTPNEEGRWATHFGKFCPTGACPADMWLENVDLTGPSTFKAGSAIRTGDAVTVKAGNTVTFQAFDMVVLNSGFTVEQTANFTVNLTAGPCM